MEKRITTSGRHMIETWTLLSFVRLSDKGLSKLNTKPKQDQRNNDRWRILSNVISGKPNQ